jgi:lysozyme
MIRGFDVSEAQGYLDNDFWQQAVDMDMKFVYARCSWGNGHEDTQFRHNVKMAHNYGLKVGAYHYDYSLTPDVTAEHARKCAAIIADAGVLLELPVFFDLEDADDWKYRNGYDFTGATATAQCIAWLDNIGLNAGVYASYSWLNRSVSSNDGFVGDGQPINWYGLSCPVWNAQWGHADDLRGYVWQDTDQLLIGGRQVDGDYMYDDSLFV